MPFAEVLNGLAGCVRNGECFLEMLDSIDLFVRDESNGISQQTSVVSVIALERTVSSFKWLSLAVIRHGGTQTFLCATDIVAGCSRWIEEVCDDMVFDAGELVEGVELHKNTVDQLAAGPFVGVSVAHTPLSCFVG